MRDHDSLWGHQSNDTIKRLTPALGANVRHPRLLVRQLAQTARELAGQPVEHLTLSIHATELQSQGKGRQEGREYGKVTNKAKL